MTDPEAERYKLSSEESRRRFVERIVPALLAGREPQQEPTAVILLGRPGAGKTRVSEMIARRLNERGGFARIDTGLYKPFHPDYRELMARDDRLMTLFIGPEGREWMRQAQDVRVTTGGYDGEWKTDRPPRRPCRGGRSPARAGHGGRALGR